MTNPNSTLIAILVDRSGSMAKIKEDTEGGLKTFLDEQAKAKPDESVSVTLAQFDSEYELVYENQPILDVPSYRLVPRGMTALFDGIGFLVSNVGESLAKLDESKRPHKVIVVILTDGGENNSREWRQNTVKELIEQQKNVYAWDFVFLGANIDAVTVAGGVGISRGSALTYEATGDGVTSAFASASGYATRTRSNQKADFSEADREKAKKSE